MKKYLYCIFFLLLMVVPLMGIPYEQTEEYSQKQAILSERAVRFKAETGFEGDITYNHQYMKFSQLYGTFNDIHLTAPNDTISAECAFDKVLLRITPFISASEGQLIPSIIERSQYMVSKKWEQKINGYSVHPGGIISISFNIDTQEFIINDSTVDIPNTPIPINISKEDAKQIMINEYKKSEYYNGRVRGSSQEPSIAYNRISTSKDPLQYRLYWSMMFFQVSFSIDVETLEIHQHMNIMMYNIFAVRGKTYKPTISGLVFDPTTPPESSLRGINVVNGDQNGFTDPNGYIQLSLSPQENYKVSLRGERWDIRSIYNESTSLNVDYYTEIGPMNYETNILDVIDTQDELNPAPPSLYAANIYYHLQNQDDIFRDISPSFSLVTYPVIYNDNEALPANDWGGVFEVNDNTGTVAIHYYNGYNPYIIMHELSHFYTFNRMNSLTFSGVASTMLDKAMDEAFAEYWLGRGLVTNSHIRNYSGNSIAIDLLDIYDIHSSAIYNNLSLTLNEDFYSWYYCGMPIAAVWEDIRTSLWFDVFDIKLLGALTSITVNDQDLSKPRYFYNVLMRTSTPNAQMIIDKAYSGRGLNFTPQVISSGVSNPPDGRDKNMFRIGDPVHVKVTNCPQNTPLTVYVVEDQDYTDGMNISALNTIICQVSGTSGPDGVWFSSTPVMTASTVGDYDILVDIGNNGVLHFAYNGANVHDGFDGLNGPGFTVYDDGIDVVLALDLSQSMVGESANLQRLTRSFIGAMQPGDKINIFGFNEGTPPNWYGGYTNLPPTTTAQLYSITSSNQASLISSVGLPSAGGNTDILVPFTYGYNRFGAPTEREKGMVLLSDGEHHPTIRPEHPNDPYFSNPHRMYWVSNSINSNYNPRGIECYTMRFGNIPSGIQNMGNIASWGHGVAYQVPQLANMSLIVSRLINRLRGNPPSYENNHSIPPNSNQTLQIVVDDLADNLQTTLIWNTSGNPSANLFTLTSPSGVIYNQPEYFGTLTLKYAIDVPESGVWSANITNNYSTTQTYSIISEVDSDLVVAVEEIPAMYPVDRPLLLQVSVSDYNTPISSATVNAQLKRGEWQFSVELYDDGCHNDRNAGDGLFGNYLYAYAELVNEFPSYQQYGDFDLSIIVDIPSINGRRVVNQNLYLSPIQPNSYPQVTRNLHKGWNWVGYPRLQRDEVGTSIDYANASLSPFLTDIVSSDGIAEYRDNQWVYNGLSELKSEPGYKLRINDTTSVRLFELGTIIDTLMVHQLYEGQWNWVTYPCYETVYPWEALSGVLNRIDYIMAEDWSMKKDGGVWIYDGFTRPHLKYGDSIMIRTVRDCGFVWNNPLTTPIIVDPRKPSYFVYEDKPNYETIMIESIEGNPDYTEIGVFQDDVCIGARVNEAYPIQILAYSTSAEEGGGALSFMLYSENKGAISVSPAAIHPGNYNANEPTIEPELYGFRMLTLKTTDQQIPSVLALHSNYPNPFNPSTTLNFSLPKTALVKLVIYNIRGQQVKNLLNVPLDCGNHSVVWNGRDDSNRPVASGVYFARLEQSGVTKISKMMLMK